MDTLVLRSHCSHVSRCFVFFLHFRWRLSEFHVTLSSFSGCYFDLDDVECVSHGQKITSHICCTDMPSKVTSTHVKQPSVCCVYSRPSSLRALLLICLLTNQHTTGFRRIKMFIYVSNKLPVTVTHWRIPLILGPRGSTSSSLNVIIIIITGRPSYTVVDCRRPSVSGRCCSLLGRTVMPHHVCNVPPADNYRHILSAVPFPTLCSACELSF